MSFDVNYLKKISIFFHKKAQYTALDLSFNRNNLPNKRTEQIELYHVPEATSEWADLVDKKEIDPANISHKFNLPKIEEYHLHFDEEYKKEFLKNYEELRSKLNEFKDVYDFANQQLSTKPDYGLDQLNLIEAIKKLPDILYLESIRHQQKTLGEIPNKSILFDFLNGKISLFNNTNDPIYFINMLINIIDNMLEKYDSIPAKADKLREKLNKEVEAFLNNQEVKTKLHFLSNKITSQEFIKEISRFPSYELDRIFLKKYVNNFFEDYSKEFTHSALSSLSNRYRIHLTDKAKKIIEETSNKYENILLAFEHKANIIRNTLESEELSIDEENKIILDFLEEIKLFFSNNGIDLQSYFDNIKMTENEFHNFCYNYIRRISLMDPSFPMTYILDDKISKKIALEYLNTPENEILSDSWKQEIDDILKKEAISYFLEKFPDRKVINVIKHSGEFSFKGVANTLKKIFFTLGNKEIINLTNFAMQNKEFLVYATQNGQAGEILFSLLQKNNKLDLNNIKKYFSTETYLNNIYNHIGTIELYNRNSNEKILNNEEITKLSSEVIRMPETIERDLNNLEEVIKICHNSAANLKYDQILNICKNKNFDILNKLDSVKKLYSAYMSIIVDGGPLVIKSKYKSAISQLKDKKMISNNFINNLQTLVNFFESNEKFNPETLNFENTLKICYKVDSDLTMVKTADSYKELYEKAETKDPALFLLNYSINPRLRFRVLKDKDPRHLKIGIETNCCQRVGDDAAGETAARDSFINRLAGVLILEWFNDKKEWVLLAQSYFHYVPKDQSYILDNIETNSYNVSKSGINLEEVYAFYANEMKNKLSLKYFVAGKGYSKLEISKFKTYKMKKDPRSFNPNSLTKKKKTHYTDFSQNSIDLTRAKFKIKTDPQTWGTNKTGKK